MLHTAVWHKILCSGRLCNWHVSLSLPIYHSKPYGAQAIPSLLTRPRFDSTGYVLSSRYLSVVSVPIFCLSHHSLRTQLLPQPFPPTPLLFQNDSCSRPPHHDAITEPQPSRSAPFSLPSLCFPSLSLQKQRQWAIWPLSTSLPVPTLPGPSAAL